MHEFSIAQSVVSSVARASMVTAPSVMPVSGVADWTAPVVSDWSGRPT